MKICAKIMSGMIPNSSDFYVNICHLHFGVTYLQVAIPQFGDIRKISEVLHMQ